MNSPPAFPAREVFRHVTSLGHLSRQHLIVHIAWGSLSPGGCTEQILAQDQPAVSHADCYVKMQGMKDMHLHLYLQTPICHFPTKSLMPALLAMLCHNH